MSSSLRPVWIHSSLDADSLRRKRESSMSRGEINSIFLYESARQSDLWLKLHAAHSPARQDSVQKIYQAIAQSVAATVIGPVSVVALGCGGSEKDQFLLKSLGSIHSFFPIDTSVTLSLLSASMSDSLPIEQVVPCAGDLRDWPSLASDLNQWDKNHPRVFTFYGMLPNFEPGEAFELLRSWIRPGDHLLLSTNLSPAEDETDDSYRRATEKILPQYDNPETREWLWRVVQDWGLEQEFENPKFTIEPSEGLLRFVAACQHRKNGKPLRLFFSYRYTPARLRATAEQYGFRIVTEFIDPSREEGVWHLRLA